MSFLLSFKSDNFNHHITADPHVFSGCILSVPSLMFITAHVGNTACPIHDSCRSNSFQHNHTEVKPSPYFELMNVIFSVQFKHEQNAPFIEKIPNWFNQSSTCIGPAGPLSSNTYVICLPFNIMSWNTTCLSHLRWKMNANDILYSGRFSVVQKQD
jgi:hypothetical protein